MRGHNSSTVMYNEQQRACAVERSTAHAPELYVLARAQHELWRMHVQNSIMGTNKICTCICKERD